MRSKVIFVIIMACSLVYPMQTDKDSGESFKPSQEQINYINGLYRATLSPLVRTFMHMYPDDTYTKLLTRYISIATENFWKNNHEGKKLPVQFTSKDFSSFVCEENLVKLFQAKTCYDMQICVATMGAVYDFSQPCKAWEHVLVVAQEQIKRKCHYYGTKVITN